MIQPALHASVPSPQRPLSTSAIPLDQVGVLREMLSDIENHTSAGQVYLMEKVVNGLETELARKGQMLAELEQRRLRRQLDGLAEQASHLAPLSSRFIDGAEVVMGLLGASRREPA